MNRSSREEDTICKRTFQAPRRHGSTCDVGGGAASVDGVISTRRGNGTNWLPMIGRAPVGEWELALPDSAEVRSRFRDEEIEDILLVITFGGMTPAWPN